MKTQRTDLVELFFNFQDFSKQQRKQNNEKRTGNYGMGEKKYLERMQNNGEKGRNEGQKKEYDRQRRQNNEEKRTNIDRERQILIYSQY